MTGDRMALDTFSTARLLAERLMPAHKPDVERMDRNEGFMAHLGGVRDAAATQAYLDRNLAHWAIHDFGLWILRDMDHREVVGRAVLRHVDVEGVDEVELGYGFYPECWGRGLATEVALACVRIGRTQLRIPSLVAITLPSHAASQHVLRKAGLSYEREFLHEGRSCALFRTRQETRP
jgi:RimJ/RimL family protein N-acetyltransferase